MLLQRPLDRRDRAGRVSLFRRVVLGLCLVASACGLDLRPLPGPDTTAPLSVTPPSLLLAPHESVAFVATGGVSPYRWLLEGPDDGARLVEGKYIAGGLPGAERRVVVVDARNVRAESVVRVGVGLSVIPPELTVAPGSRVSFQATGGKPPYMFFLESNTSGASIDALTGAYVAGPVGSVIDLIEVRDATGVSVVRGRVQVGPVLRLLKAQTGPVPPLGEVALIVLGGQPPYALNISTQRSGDSRVDGALLTYRAGALGGETDIVTVIDANDQQASLDIAVGTALSLTLSTQTLWPSGPARWTASGGLPPYRFSFARHGNRSFGTLDPISGAYVPGPNVGAIDQVQVWDATGAAMVQAETPAIGPTRLDGGGVYRCRGSDLDDDGRAEMIWMRGYWLRTAGRRFGSQWFQLDDYALEFVTADVDRDLYNDLLVCADEGLLLMRSTGDGRFAPSMWLARRGSRPPGRAALAVASTDSGHVAFLMGDDLGPCGADGGFMQVDIPASAPQLARVSCAVPGLEALPAEAVAADFDRDGALDLAWVSREQGALWVRFGPDFIEESKVLMPEGARYTQGRWGMEYALLSVAFPVADDRNATDETQPPDQVAVVALQGPREEALLWSVRFPSRSQPVSTVLELEPAGSPPIEGITVVPSVSGGTAELLVWNGVDGRVRHSFVSRDGSLHRPEPVADVLDERSYAVDCVAAADFTGDEVPDLVTGSALVEWSEQVMGMGPDGFGTRYAFAAGKDDFAPLVADIDGDGRDDLLSYHTDPALHYLAGSDHQLGWQTPIALDGPIFRNLWLDDIDRDAVADLVFDADGRGLVWRQGVVGGLFAAAVAFEDLDWLAFREAAAQLVPISLGRPGRDWLAMDDNGDVHAYERINASTGRRITVPASPSEGCLLSGADIDGDGADDALLWCARSAEGGVIRFGTPSCRMDDRSVESPGYLCPVAAAGSVAAVEVYVSTSLSSRDARSFAPWKRIGGDAPTLSGDPSFLVATARHEAFLVATDAGAGTHLWRAGHGGAWSTSAKGVVLGGVVGRLNGDMLQDVALRGDDGRLVSVFANAEGWQMPVPAADGEAAKRSLYVVGGLVACAALGDPLGPCDLISLSGDRYVIYPNSGNGVFKATE